MTRSRTDSPNAIAAIAVDVAVRALGGRRATEAGTASDEASEVVDALLPRVTRLSVRKRLSGRGGKSDREGRVGADEMGFDAMDADTLFGERSTEGSLRGGTAMFHERKNSFDGEIKFESALPTASDDAVIPTEEGGRRPPTPGKTRPWLKESRATPMQVDDERAKTCGDAVPSILASPKRNGSMLILNAEDHDTKMRCVGTPTLVPRARRAEVNSPTLVGVESPSAGTPSEQSIETSDHKPFSRSASTLSTVSLASAFSPVSRPMSRNASQEDLSKY